MPPHKLMRRWGEDWTIVRKVPADIFNVIEKTQIWRSLKMGHRKTTNSHYLVELAKIEATFDQAWLDQTIANLVSLEAFEVQWCLASALVSQI